MKYDEIKKLLEDNINSILDEDKYKKFLNTMGNFHNYSLNNQILIYIQMPTAFKVAGYHKWHEMGRQVVKKGAIGIIAPNIGNRYIDTKTGEYLKKGELSKSELKKAIDSGLVRVSKECIGYYGVNVFDISQTQRIDGKEDEPGTVGVDGLHGQYEHRDKLLKALSKVTNSPIIVDDSKVPLEAYGVHMHGDDAIYVRDLQDIQVIKTAIHEVGHSVVKRIQKNKKYYTGKYLGWESDGTEMLKLDRATEEIVVETAAYIVSNKLGIDTSEYSFSYVGSWAQMLKSDDKKQEILDNVEYISIVVNKILSTLDEEFSVEATKGEEEIAQIAKEEQADSLLSVMEANALRCKLEN